LDILRRFAASHRHCESILLPVDRHLSV
jgi:hypothetical protein